MVVAGASSGVGRATARAFAQRGDHVGLISREGDGLAAALAEARLLTTAVGAPADMADADAVEAAADRIERELGPIDVWVNVAMLSVFGPVRDLRADEVRRVTEVTYLGHVHGTLAALPDRGPGVEPRRRRHPAGRRGPALAQHEHGTVPFRSRARGVQGVRQRGRARAPQLRPQRSPRDA